MFKKLFLFTLLLLIGLSAIAIYLFQQPIVLPGGKNSIEIEVKRGQTLSQLANDWERAGWLPSAPVLLLQAKVMGAAKNIKPGEYEIVANTRGYELLAQLALGSNKRYRVSFIEGTRLIDALERLKAAPKLVQDVKPLTSAAVQHFFELTHHAEGWIYPDTYVYQAGDRVSDILQQARSRMESVLTDEWASYQRALAAGEIKKLPYKDAYEALIMASIVEKETGQVSERPEIAGVFVRRLEKNMRLETDPTVIYGLGEDYAGNLRKKHLRDRSNPYNTYRMKGLPPTPIALAGRAAINATLNPKDGDSLFFVAKGDGSHYFSATLAEHNKAVRKYQIYKRSKDYRSAPAPQ
jgi:UPF0755 protein